MPWSESTHLLLSGLAVLCAVLHVKLTHELGDLNLLTRRVDMEDGLVPDLRRGAQGGGEQRVSLDN